MKNLLKKSIVFYLILLLTLSNFTVTTLASDVDKSKNEFQIATYAEQTKWYYRYQNGKKQKRLWSVTYGYWLTNWMAA